MKLDLSENALRVLERRYLIKDAQGRVIEAPEELFRRVAKSIAQVDELYDCSSAEIKGLEEGFFNMMARLEFMPNTPTLINAGRALGQLSACFAPDQLIITKEGVCKISEIEVGDEVLTHQHRFRGVLMNSKRRIAEEIYTISVYKLPTQTLKVTGEHPILAVKKSSERPQWIQVKDLSVNDYVALTYPKEGINVESIKVSGILDSDDLIEKEGYLFEKNKDIRTYVRKDGSIYIQNRNRSGKLSKHVNKVKNVVSLDSNLMRLFGYYLSEGCTSNGEALRFTFSDKEVYYAEDVLNIVKEKFGISSHIETTNSLDRKWLSIRFHSKILAQFFEKLLGTGYDKKIIPYWMVLLPCEKQKGLLAGMFRGDSTTFKNGNNICTKLVMCNTNLVYSVWQIIMRLGIFTGLNFEYMPKLGKVRPVRCSVSGKYATTLINELLEKEFQHNGNEYIRHKIIDGTVFTPIVNISKQFYNDWVFNLEVEEDHSYCANMISVHNCFVVPISDSMESIFDAVKACAIIHRTGGGTGMSFSRLRSKDSIVKTTGGLASGPVSFMRVFDAATQAVRQGGVRRGANMGILRVDHPDILEFITCKDKTNEITNFNISVAITEHFMSRFNRAEDYDLIDPNTKKVTGQLNTVEVFDLIVKQAHKNGEPGVIFIDWMNEFNPTPKLGKYESTNPCITADSLIPTEKGLISMGRLAQDYPNGGIGILNSIGFFKPSCIFTTGRREVFKIKTKAGYELKVTADHPILTKRGWIKVKNLEIGKDEIQIQSREGKFSNNKQLPFDVAREFKGRNGRVYKTSLPSEWSEDLGILLGWLIGDGNLHGKNESIFFYFGKDDSAAFKKIKSILKNFYGREPVVSDRGWEWQININSKLLFRFFEDLGIKRLPAHEKHVPKAILSASTKAVIGFLKGLFSSDGTANYVEGKSSYVRLSSASLSLLKEVQILLINLGIFSRIYENRKPEGKSSFNYVTKNGQKRNYQTKTYHELEISRRDVVEFIKKIGFIGEKNKQKVELLLEKSQRKRGYYKRERYTVVKRIELIGKNRVYDLTEPITHSFVANGITIHNCGEQVLLPFESCNLGSINLVQMIKKTDSGYGVDWEKLKETIDLAVHFLDNVIDANRFPLSEIEKATKLTRKIGLGIMGWASLLIRLGIPYNSEEAIELADKLMSFVLNQAKEKSSQLARRKGVFPAFKDSTWEKQGLSLRNATLTTIAPTGTISIIAGPTSSGIEPLFAISFYRNVMDNDRLVEVEPLFEQLAKERGFYSRQLMERIAEVGSIQKIEEIPEEIKRVFVTAHDISPDWHIRMQAVYQKYTNNAVSKTVNCPHDATVEDIRKAYLLAYKLNCKGITVYRDQSRQEQVLNITGKQQASGAEETNGQVSKIIPRGRPEVTIGTTTKVSTGCGNLYITINSDEHGRAFEVFTQMGKAGGCAASQLEAIGRLVSLAFRSNIDVKAIIEQLRNIRCPSPSWEKGIRIFSCADALARVIEKRLVNVNNRQNSAPALQESHSQPAVFNIVGVCPDCGGALRHEEGCVKCYACGFTKC